MSHSSFSDPHREQLARQQVLAYLNQQDTYDLLMLANIHQRIAQARGLARQAQNQHVARILQASDDELGVSDLAQQLSKHTLAKAARRDH